VIGTTPEPTPCPSSPAFEDLNTPQGARPIGSSSSAPFPIDNGGTCQSKIKDCTNVRTVLYRGRWQKLCSSCLAEKQELVKEPAKEPATETPGDTTYLEITVVDDDDDTVTNKRKRTETEKVLENAETVAEKRRKSAAAAEREFRELLILSITRPP
jgi:hypothetical protein